MRSAALLFLLPLALAAQIQVVTGGVGVSIASPLPVAAPPPVAQPATTTPPEDLASVEGLVVNALTGEPVKKARVDLRRTDVTSGAPPRNYLTVSDAAGKFTMKDLEPGRYQLSANRDGFVNSPFGMRGPGTPLALGRAQQMKEIKLRLTPQGVVTGRILDEDGDPLSQVQVMLVRYRYQIGGRQLQPFSSATTNDLGEYRIFGVAPGKYYVSATYRQGGGVLAPGLDRSATPQPEETYVPTYFPGTSDANTALQIEVALGGQVSNVSLSLVKTRSVHISGHVVNAPGQMAGAVLLSLAPRRGGSVVRDAPYPISAGGQFEIRGVTPGSYSLTAFANRDGKTYSARQSLEVGSSNIESVALTLGTGTTVSGHVSIDGDRSASLQSVRVTLRPRQGGIRFTPVPNNPLKEDQTFLLEGVAPDEYDVMIIGLPDGFYTKKIRAGETDGLTAGLDLTSGAPASLEITLSPNAGQLRGQVQNPSTQQAAPGATVALVPQEKERRDQQTYYRTVITDQSGSFALKGIVPGEYKAYAWEDIEFGAYFDPDFLKTFESKGKSVSVPEGSQLTEELTMIQADATSNTQ